VQLVADAIDVNLSRREAPAEHRAPSSDARQTDRLACLATMDGLTHPETICSFE
jgi:hypothetical protein